MDKNTVLDKGYFIATILNSIFLLGLIFVYQSDNPYILIPYTIVMVVNAIYLVVKVGKINRDKPKI
ncbi:MULTISPECIES: hypothetical protein [Staphylococcus]|uniref:hypothetical protein n=1 Tax=Staphylococcus TaxID=1279 RepID=UPI0011A59599|nr:hypothetical protein [Staphylococcus epidermidis]MBM0811436.1 hypothetical protein [Staphylococcus epidermidis]MCG1164979.1 hypothetical protein [Staphylococcus epidermidis]MCG1589713.1 hypothetical protein [Staphylococcus epidermidis]MCG2085454.1 hypothetical protein [Staphylococcus epidermidis]MCG2103348.1 hypothetical protein [Staphylococcus epidermidis]